MEDNYLEYKYYYGTHVIYMFEQSCKFLRYNNLYNNDTLNLIRIYKCKFPCFFMKNNHKNPVYGSLENLCKYCYCDYTICSCPNGGYWNAVDSP